MADKDQTPREIAEELAFTYDAVASSNLEDLVEQVVIKARLHGLIAGVEKAANVLASSAKMAEERKDFKSAGLLMALAYMIRSIDTEPKNEALPFMGL